MNRNLLRLFVFILCSCVSQATIQASNANLSLHQDTNSVKIIYRALTVAEEFDHVIGLIKRAPFFKANGYKIAFPQHPTFVAIIRNPEILEQSDISALQQVFKEQIYKSEDYDNDVLDMAQTKSFVEQAIAKLALLKVNWHFKLMDEYQILLTLYGPGSQYSEKGFIFTLSSAKLLTANKDLAENIVHELVHIGIEEDIIRKYRLTQGEKERLVDLICSLYLHELMPNYDLQKRGDTKIDHFVSLNEITHNLPSAIEKFIACNPR